MAEPRRRARRPRRQDRRLRLQPGSHVVVDVFGYFVEDASSRAGRYVGLTPGRILDTRAGAGRARRHGARTSSTCRSGSGWRARQRRVRRGRSTSPPPRRHAAGYVQVLPGRSAQFGQWSNLNLVPRRPDHRQPRDRAARRHRPRAPLHPRSVPPDRRRHGLHHRRRGTCQLGRAVHADPTRPHPRHAVRGSPASARRRRITVSNAAWPAANPSAVLLNVTATEPLGSGYLQVYPTGAAVEQGVVEPEHRTGRPDDPERGHRHPQCRRAVQRLLAGREPRGARHRRAGSRARPGRRRASRR